MATRAALSTLTLLASVALLPFELQARADELSAHYDSAALVERSHRIEATLHPGYAELVVRRELFNGSERPDEAQFRVALPAGAVAVGLRTRGHGPGAPWFAGKLLDSELAAAQYLELTGRGTAMLRDPALLYWLSPDSVGLQIFPCPPRTSQWVEYTVWVPTRYEDGAHVLSVESLGTDALRATWAVRPADARAHLETSGLSLAAGAALTVTPEVDAPLEVRLFEAAPAPLRGEFASAELGTGRSLVHASWRAAPRISSVPEGIHLAVLLDTSRSMGGDAMRGYARILAGLLPHFPGVRVALVAVDRAARPITGGFVAPERATEALAAFPRALRNGSELGLGLEAVAQLFRGVPASARRLLVLTDTATRTGLTAAALGKSLDGAGALTHWSSLEGGDAEPAVEAEHPLAAAVRASGGLTWSVDASASSSEEFSAALEDWARPLRYRGLALRLAGQAWSHDGVPETLDEGSGFDVEALVSGQPSEVTLRAELWGRAVEFELNAERGESRRRAAFVAGQGFHSEYELTEPEWHHLAEFAGAVTPWTSYLALEPGVRPSTSGIVREEGLGLGGISELGGGGFGSGTAGGVGWHFDAQAYLEERVRALKATCAAAGALTVTLETTSEELAEIVRLELSPPEPRSTSCLSEALWAEMLPKEFARIARRTTTVAL
ncbi:MAG TPA: hypothetical protein VLC09_04025 [Polyangiaceae bacterium]|nr:hypothetical protein [Polyangiaceae bacterium]